MKIKFEKRFKKGWTLVELCVAMVALAILIGISVQSIRPKKVLIAPFVYAGVQNLRNANNYILHQCSDKGTERYSQIYGCSEKELPDSTHAVSLMQTKWDTTTDPTEQAKLGPRPTLATMNDVLCSEVASIFTLLGDEVNCKYSGSPDGSTTSAGNTEIKLPKGNGKGNNAGKPNFQASNMVAYYFLEGPWLPINIAKVGAIGTDDRSPVNEPDGSNPGAYFKAAFIDVNGDKGPNKLGEDQFPIRIYKDGEITPGTCRLYEDEKVSGVNYNLRCPDGNTEGNWLTSNYPFAYNMYRAYIPEDTEGDKYSNENMKVQNLGLDLSYQEAACRTDNSKIPTGKNNDGRGLCSDDGSSKETDINEKLPISPPTTIPGFNSTRIKMFQLCYYKEVPNSYCFVRVAKPSNPGLFRLPIM